MSFTLDPSTLPLAAFEADEHGRVTAANDAFARLLGHDRGEQVPGDVLSSALGEHFAAWLASRSPRRLWLPSTPPRLVEVVAAKRGAGLAGVLVDRTAEHDLGERNANFLDRAPFGLVILQDGLVAWENARQQTLAPTVGKSLDQLVDALVLAEDREAVRQLLRVRVAGEASPGNCTFRQRRGTVEHTFELWTERVEYRGRPAVQAIVLDVSDRIRAERELALLDRKYQHAQKLEAIGRLAGGIAHDFNNLLTVISGSVELVRRRASEQVRDDLELIADAAQRAGDMTLQLLAFSRQDPGSTKTFDLNQVVARLERMLTRLVGEHIELKLSLSEQPLWVHANEAHLEQVLANLTVNACDAMPKGGRVEITSGLSDRGDGVGRFAKLVVLDSGTGIDAEVLPHVFEPFFTTKAVGKGTGLGLSTVRGHVEQAGGFVELESSPGLGTAVYVFLPTTQAPAVVSARPSAPVRVRTPRKVLVVEDEPLVRAVVMRVLGRAGHVVTAVGSAKEALAKVAEEAFDLVLTDVVMPLMGGVELAQRLVEARPSLPVIFMTGYADDRALPPGITSPPGPTLRKPFAPDQLLDVVDTATSR